MSWLCDLLSDSWLLREFIFFVIWRFGEFTYWENCKAEMHVSLYPWWLGVPEFILLLFMYCLYSQTTLQGGCFHRHSTNEEVVIQRG